jgi:uncharacterized protein (DUF433 family)
MRACHKIAPGDCAARHMRLKILTPTAGPMQSLTAGTRIGTILLTRDIICYMEPTSEVENTAAASPMHGRALGDRIVTTPGVRGGKPRIAGHRITVSDVAIWHERMGMSPDEIVSEYPSITLSDVHAALAYYFDHRDDVDREIRDGEEFAEKLRAGAPSIFEELTARKANAADDPVSS